MKNIFKILSLLFLLVVFDTTFSSSWFLIENSNDNKKTIVELKNEVNNLIIDRRWVNAKLLELKNETNITTYFRNNLTKSELWDLKYLMNIYYNTKDDLDIKLKQESQKLNKTEDIKEDLLRNKKDIYKELVPYISKSKIKKYLEFIKKDIEVLKNKNNITDSKIKKNIILKEKVDFIKEKIIEHEKDFSKKLKHLIVWKIDTILLKFKLNNKFKKLSIKDKTIILNNILEKIQQKIDKLNNIENSTSILNTKIEIYNILKVNLDNMLLKIKTSP